MNRIWVFERNDCTDRKWRIQSMWRSKQSAKEILGSLLRASHCRLRPYVPERKARTHTMSKSLIDENRVRAIARALAGDIEGKKKWRRICKMVHSAVLPEKKARKK